MFKIAVLHNSEGPSIAVDSGTIGTLEMRMYSQTIVSLGAQTPNYGELVASATSTPHLESEALRLNSNGKRLEIRYCKHFFIEILPGLQVFSMIDEMKIIHRELLKL